MSQSTFRERLEQAKPILADGAMGTMLQQQTTLNAQACFEELNLSQPDLVQSVHEQYLKAGAELIETNTFAANRMQLNRYGLGDQVIAINEQAVRIARAAIAAVGVEAYIAGSVGPLGVPLGHESGATDAEAAMAFAEQITILAKADVDVLLFETFDDHHELLIAVNSAKELFPEIPVIAQIKFSTTGTTITGYAPPRAASALHRLGVDVIGVNCGGGPAHVAETLEQVRYALPNVPLSVMPNAGFAEVVGGRSIYGASATYFGESVAVLQAADPKIIGGCCGTTPDHIAAMRAALDTPTQILPQVQSLDLGESITEDEIAHPTELSQRLDNGEFTITVEMTPPRSYDAEKMLADARVLRDAGAHLLDVADTPAAKMKMSAWAAAHLLQSQVGMETILHFPTRGRNLLRIQGDLLAAHALDLRNLFVTMGDPTRIGDYPDAMDAYDIAPSKLIDLISHSMNAGCDMAGKSIGKPTHFTVGCALNMGAEDFDREMRVLRRKLAGGADFALGQAIFEPHKVEAFLQRYEQAEGNPFDLPVIMGVIPLHSVRHASFLHNEVPGIHIPQHIFTRLETAGENAPQVGVEIARELIEGMRSMVQGMYLIPSYGRYELAAEVLA